MKATYFMSLILLSVILLGTTVFLEASDIDGQIESAIKQSYVFKTYLKDEDIKVNSKKGVVTLTGTISEETKKTLAYETAAETPNVKSVDNKLNVREKHSSENLDAWLKTKVISTLLFHRNVSSNDTDIEVEKGIVTLRGNAESDAQKELTAEYVKDIEGVKDVKNEIKVLNTSKKSDKDTMSEAIDDASVTAQIKMTLLFHRSTSSYNTKVKTNNGIVTLTGKASNAAEKDLVTKFVSDIKGVKSINNMMTVE